MDAGTWKFTQLAANNLPAGSVILEISLYPQQSLKKTAI